MLVNIRFIVPIDNQPGDLSNSILSSVTLRNLCGVFSSRETYCYLTNTNKFKYYEVNNVHQN